MANDVSLAPKLPDPFDRLPVCPPGMLVGPEGLPAKSGGIVSEEWLQARPNANTLLPEGSVSKPTIPDSEYPLRISWDGILVDDPGCNGGQPHREDIVYRVREALEVLWKERAEAIELEACEILRPPRPSGLFPSALGFLPGSSETLLKEPAEGADLLAIINCVGVLHLMGLLPSPHRSDIVHLRQRLPEPEIG